MLGALAALAVAMLVTLLVVRNDEGGGGKQVAAGTSTTGSSSSTTSSSTSSSSTSTTALAPTTTAAAATTVPPTTIVLPVVTGQGAVLQPPSTPETRATTPGSGCNALADPGWTATCATTAVRGGVLAWLIETKAADGGGTARRDLVFRRGTAQQWTLVQQAADESGTRFANVRARVEDISGDGLSDIAFGFTRTGTGGVLAVDLIEGPGGVALHRELQKGVARVSSGQLDTWRRTDGSHYAHEVIQFRDGAWRIVASATVPNGDVPPSQL